MKLENYVLNIYCDNKDVHPVHGLIMGTHHRIYGGNAGDCRRKARKLGWKVSHGNAESKEKGRDLCPACHETQKKARVESRRKKMQASVVMLMGYPASGKSTVAQPYIDEGYVYLNRDTEGGKVSSLVPKMLEALPGKKVLLDNTFITAEMRKPFLDACKSADVRIKCIKMGTSLEDASFNACMRMIAKYGHVLTNDEIKKTKSPNTFPIAALFSARKRWEDPKRDEGFVSVEEADFVRQWGPEFKNKALILDYDGTLRDTGSGEKYPRSPKDVVVLKGRQNKLQEYLDNGYLLLGVSNQSGIGSGKVSEEDVVACFEQTNKLLKHKIDYRYCAHRAGPGGCYCRKPQVGIGCELICQYKLLPSSCIFVGDMTSDKTFAKRCGFQFEKADKFFS